MNQQEILFHAQRIDTHEWVEGDLVHEPWGYSILVTEKNGSKFRQTKHPVNPVTIGQYTNLLTCEKQRIFQNDIVTARLKSNRVRFNFVVIFEDGGFQFSNGYEVLPFSALTVVKKIGNRFDTPDQLPKVLDNTAQAIEKAG